MKHLSYPLSLSTESHTPYQSTFTGFMKLESSHFLTFVPGYNPDQKCKHGNAFSSENPIFSGWLASSEVRAYKYSVTITSATRKLYYRPAREVATAGASTMDKMTSCLILIISTSLPMACSSSTST